MTDAQKAEAKAVIDAQKYGEFEAWKAKWNDLPKYSSGTTEIVYTVKETVGYTGYQYDQESVASGGTITNTEQNVTIDLVKQDKDTKAKLKGAVFTLKQLENIAPTESGTLSYKKDKDGNVISWASAPTADTTGLTAFDKLSSGYYEIQETTSPQGYVLTSDVVFYIKVQNGAVTFIAKGNTAPSEWGEAASGGLFTYAKATGSTPATVTVDNLKGTSLPSTGGHGPAPIRALGLMLMASAAGLGWMALRRRRAR